MITSSLCLKSLRGAHMDDEIFSLKKEVKQIGRLHLLYICHFFSLAEHTLKLKILPKLKMKNYLL